MNSYLAVFFTAFLFVEVLGLGTLALMLPMHGALASILVLLVHYFACKAAVWAISGPQVKS